MPKPTGTTNYGRHPLPMSAQMPDDDAAAYDTLAELFLGEVGGAVESPPLRAVPAPRVSNGARIAARVPSPGAAPVECLILGHLPVLGSAWVSQYARCIAEQEEAAVALVQVRAGYTTVELIAADDDLAPPPIQGRPTLEAAIGAAAAVAGRWILRVEEPDEPAAAAEPIVSTLTLLTSADEMAVVAAYRTLKRLLTAGEDAGEMDGPPPSPGAGSPSVRVSIMGAPDEAADAVFAKLAEATRMFIHRPIGRAPGVHRITPRAASVVLYSGPADDGAQRALAAIAEARQRPRRRQPSAPEATATGPVRRITAPHGLPPLDDHAAPAAVPASRSDAPPQLTSLVSGLQAVRVVCPYASEVLFGVDEKGRLHALAQDDSPGGASLQPLTVAAAWAAAHTPLLSAAVPQLAAGAEPPVLHMFVSEPREVRRLLDADLRIHLLAPVTVEGRTAWVCRDLN